MEKMEIKIKKIETESNIDQKQGREIEKKDKEDGKEKEEKSFNFSFMNKPETFIVINQ